MPEGDVVLRGTRSPGVDADGADGDLDDLAVAHRQHIVARRRAHFREHIALVVRGDHVGAGDNAVRADTDDVRQPQRR